MPIDEGLRVSISGDASGLEQMAKQAAQALGNVDNAVKQSDLTWRQFVGQRMGSYMKQFGGHGPAIKKIAEEWQAYKATLGTVSVVQNQVASSAAKMATSAAVTGVAVAKSGKDFTNLSRVIQDLPYGFQGIQNNLTQLIPGVGAAGLAFTALITAVNFAQIGFGAWTRGLGGSKEALDDQVEAINKAKQAIENYITTLNDIDKARVKGLQNAQEELVNLRTLYEATQNANIPLATRRKLVDELQEQYPKYFGNIKDEIILVGGAERAYKNLSAAIIASARTKAAEEGLIEIQRKVIAKEKQYAKSISETAKAESKVNEVKAKGFAIETTLLTEKSGQVTKSNDLVRAETALNDKKKEQLQIQKELNDLYDGARQLAGEVKRNVEANPEALLNPTGNLPKAKNDKEKTAFLFDFLPFDPSGKLKPQQRGQLLEAIGKFEKEFGQMILGANFTGDESSIIRQAISLDLDIKAGRVKFNKDFLKDVITEDDIPKEDIAQVGAYTVDQYIRGFKNESERIKGQNVFNLPVDFNINTNLESQFELFKTNLQRIGAQIPKEIEGIDIFGNPVTISIEDIFDTSKISNKDAIDALRKAFEGIRAESISEITDLTNEINAAFSNAFTSGFSNLGESIGEAISQGGGVIEAASKSIAMTIGDLVSNMGKALVKYGVQKSILDKLLAAGFVMPGGAAIAAGVGMVAAGALIKAQFTKVKGFATGGLVFGPTLGLVGEGPGTSRTNPEVIAPLDKLKSFINPAGAATVAMPQGEWKIRGRDLVFVMTQTQKTQRRAS